MKNKSEKSLGKAQALKNLSDKHIQINGSSMCKDFPELEQSWPKLMLASLIQI